jgi:hypothetical protein
MSGRDIYALSCDTRTRTSIADGRAGASAGDQWSSAVVDCVVADPRKQNGAS